MAFNIKNEQTIQLAREMAERTGTSIAAVFDEAVAERARHVGAVDRERLARVLHHANRCASRLSSQTKAIDIGEYLYDERGLPK